MPIPKSPLCLKASVVKGMWLMLDQAYRIVFTFIGPSHAELRYIGHHHSIYDFNLFK